jgi:hypothetical protein
LARARSMTCRFTPLLRRSECLRAWVALGETAE